jgi:hypothetical protein
VELLDGLVDPGDVAEGDLGRVDRHALGARLPEGHHLRAPALHLVDDEQPEKQEDHERQDVGERGEPAGAALRLDVDRDVLGAQLVDQVLLGVVRIGGLVLATAAVELDVDPIVLRLERDLLDLALLHLVEEARIDGVLLVRPRADQLLREERQNDDNQDWKRCALEESAHDEPRLRPVRTARRFVSKCASGETTD